MRRLYSRGIRTVASVLVLAGLGLFIWMSGVCNRSEEEGFVEKRGTGQVSRAISEASDQVVVLPPVERLSTNNYEEIRRQEFTVGNGAGSIIRRELLVRTDGKYPLIAIDEEIIPGDRPGDPEEVVSRYEMVADHVIVRLQPGMTKADLAELASIHGGKIRRKLKGPSETYLLEIPEPGVSGIRKSIALLEGKYDTVAYAEPDYVVYALLTPNDEYYNHLYGMHNTGQETQGYGYGGTPDADIDAPEAWAITTGSHSVVVGVIDTGIDYTHPDLASNMWQNAGETGIDSNGWSKTTNNVDDDGNGYVDDWRGWDFINGDNDPMDDHFHGTHCAGTIGAVGNNTEGVVGVSWKVSMIGLKFLSASGSGYISDAVEAITYATMLGVDLTSNSWGGGGYMQSGYDAIEEANTNGILFVAAAGNSGTDNDDIPHYPSSYQNENIIAVAASGHNDLLASFSCYGRISVDLAAPGVYTLSCMPLDYADDRGWANPYAFASGTSMATPHVSGAIALLKALAPSMPHLEVRDRLFDTLDPKPAFEYKTSKGGRLNVFSMLNGISEEPAFDISEVTVDDSVGGNNDGVINPGETVTVSVAIYNYGYNTASNVDATVSTTNGYVALSDATSHFGTVSGRTAAVAADTIEFDVAPGCPTPEPLDFEMELVDASSRTSSLPFTLTVFTSTKLGGSVKLDGAPLSGAEVGFEGPMSGSVASGGDGSFEKVAGQGSYALSASYGDDPLSVTPTQSVSVPPAQTNLLFTFTNAALAGFVRDAETLDPIEGAVVTYSGPVIGMVTTDVNGAYSVTRVFGDSWSFTVEAEKKPQYIYESGAYNLTLPPSTTNVNFLLGSPSVGFMPDYMIVTAGVMEVVNRTMTITNSGHAKLDWAASGAVSAYTNGGTIVTNLPPPYTPAQGQSKHPDGQAWDGEYLYTLYRGYLYKQDPATAHTVSTQDMALTVLDYNSAWNLVGHDGVDFWFDDTVYDHNDELSYHILYAVDLETGAILNRIEVGHELYEESGEAEVLFMTLGGNYFWYRWKYRDIFTRNYVECLVKVDRNSGYVLDILELDLPDSAATTYITYGGGALWGVERYFSAGSTSHAHKINLNDGTSLYSFELPFYYWFSFCADDRGGLWMADVNDWDANGWRLIDTGERSWIDAVPGFGSLNPAESVGVNLEFDGSMPGVGVNLGAVRLDSNDPDKPSVFMPVTMVVTNGTPGGANNPPEITNAVPESSVTFIESQTQDFAVAVFDLDGDPISYSWALDGIVVSGVQTSEWSYATGFEDRGGHSVCAMVQDGNGGFDQHVWQVTVTESNRAPVATGSYYEVPNDEDIEIELNATDADGDSLTYTVLAGPHHGSITGDAPEYIYYPSNNYVGYDTLTFQANDGRDDSNIATNTIRVGYKEVIVPPTNFNVTAEFGMIVTQRFTVINNGDVSAFWFSPLEPVTDPLYQGDTLVVVDSLPTPNSGVQRGVAYDGQSLWVGNNDYSSNQRTDVMRLKSDYTLDKIFSPTNTRVWQTYLAFEGNELWGESDDWVSSYEWLRRMSPVEATSKLHLNSAAPIFEEDYGFVAGMANFLNYYVLRSVTIYGSGGVIPGGIWWLSTNDVSRVFQTPEPEEMGYDYGPVCFWNGALWTGGNVGTPIYKLNPLSGALLGILPNYEALSFIDLAPDREGGIWALYSGKLKNICTGEYILMSPDNAYIQPGETTVVDAVFHTLKAGPGTHEALIHVVSNDPDAPDETISVTFTVTAEPGDSLPVITNTSPSASLSIGTRELLSFQVWVYDPDGDPLSYRWRLDGEFQAGVTNGVYQYVPGYEDTGLHTIEIMIDDGRGGMTNHEWAVTVDPVALGLSVGAEPQSGEDPLGVEFYSLLSGGATNGGVFPSVDGMLLHEAETVSDNFDTAMSGWYLMSGNAMTVGDYLYASGAQQNIPWSVAAEVSYDIQVSAGAVYRLWMRVKTGGDPHQNGLYIGLDGSYHGIFDDYDNNETWHWKPYEKPIRLTAGKHTLQIRVRDVDYYVDRFMLTADHDYTPVAHGPLWSSAQLPEADFSWDFGDGSPASSEQSPGHTYSQPGIYTAKVSAVTAVGSVSNKVVVTVNGDTDPPEVEKVYGYSAGDRVLASFSEPVDASTATNADNYAVNRGVNVTGVAMASETSVNIFTDGLAEGEEYTLSVSGVTDVAHAANTIVPTDVDFPVIGAFHAWPRKMKMDFDGYQRAETLTNFPALVRLEDTAGGFGYDECASPYGYDLVFSDADASVQLDHEVERWDTNGTSEIWVRLPVLASNTYIWAYWGNPSATNPPPSQYKPAVWTSDYSAVWHYSTYLDSTLVYTNQEIRGPARMAAYVGRGCLWDGEDDVHNVWSFDPLKNPSRFTVSGWYRRNQHADPMGYGIENMFLSHGSNSGNYNMALGTEGNQVDLYLANAGSSTFKFDAGLEDDKWHYFTLTYDSSRTHELEFYLNGAMIYSSDGPEGALESEDSSVWLGAGWYGIESPLDGMLDEVRVSSVARSSNWVWACYANMNTNGAFTSREPAQTVDYSDYDDDLEINLYDADDDNDGMSDDFENRHGFNPLDSSDADKDEDEDGLSNHDESRAGTDPNNPTSKLMVAETTLVGSRMVLTWPSATGRLYSIQSRTNLFESLVQSVTSGLEATPPMNVFTTPPSSEPNCYFWIDLDD